MQKNSTCETRSNADFPVLPSTRSAFAAASTKRRSMHDDQRAEEDM
jgi:hypothetical protein